MKKNKSLPENILVFQYVFYTVFMAYMEEIRQINSFLLY